MAESAPEEPKIKKQATISEDNPDVTVMESTELTDQTSIIRKANETKTAIPKKLFTQFLMKGTHVMNAHSVLHKHFFEDKPAEMDSKSYAIQREGLSALMKKLGLAVSEDEAQKILTMADFDGSKDCQFSEFLTTVGLALIKLEKEWSSEEVSEEEKQSREAIATAYGALQKLWVGLLGCLPEDAENKDHLTGDIWKLALSASGQGEDSAIFKERMAELDADGNAAIDMAEFLSTMIQWVGADEDEG